MNEALEQAEHTADRIRGELLRTLDELDRRRHEAMDLRHQALVHWKLVAGLGVTVVGVVAGQIALTRWLEHRAELRRRARRREAFLRAWQHPERLAPVRHSASVEWGNKAVTILGTAVMTALARRLVQRVIH